MFELELDLNLPAGTSAEDAAAAAALLQEELSGFSEIATPSATYTGPDRSGGEILQAIIMYLPLVASVAANANDILDLLERVAGWFKSKPQSTKAEQLLAAIDPRQIVVRVGPELVPLPEVTLEHIKALQENPAGP